MSLHANRAYSAAIRFSSNVFRHRFVYRVLSASIEMSTTRVYGQQCFLFRMHPTTLAAQSIWATTLITFELIVPVVILLPALSRANNSISAIASSFILNQTNQPQSNFERYLSGEEPSLLHYAFTAFSWEWISEYKQNSTTKWIIVHKNNNNWWRHTLKFICSKRDISVLNSKQWAWFCCWPVKGKEKSWPKLWRDLMMMGLAGDSCCGSSRFCRLGLWQAMRGEKVLATRDASFRLWWFIQLVQGAKR